LRRIVVITLVAVIAVAGGVVGVRSWLRDRARQAEVDGIVARATELARTEAGLSPAAVELKKALALAPDDVPALMTRGEVCLRLGQLNDAIEHATRAMELTEASDRARAQLLLGHALAERFRGSSSDADFRGAHSAFVEARQDPSCEADAIEASGWLFVTRGLRQNPPNSDTDRACSAFEELLSRHPDHPNAAKLKEAIGVFRGKGPSGS
jgi:tetratricopeptide (TPR) repeat protein